MDPGDSNFDSGSDVIWAVRLCPEVSPVREYVHRIPVAMAAVPAYVYSMCGLLRACVRRRWKSFTGSEDFMMRSVFGYRLLGYAVWECMSGLLG